MPCAARRSSRGRHESLGAALAYVIGHWLKVPLICVRKPGVSDHYQQVTQRRVEGYLPQDCRYMIVDDFIDTGRTIARIQGELLSYTSGWKDGPKVTCTAILLYATTKSPANETPICGVPVFCSRPDDVYC